MANHLIIGLGGTGGKVIREFRKRIYEEFRNIDPVKQGENQKVFIDYVYVDSSTEELNNTSDWKVMGKSVHLAEQQKVNINGINAAMLDEINMYPGLEAFLNGEDIRMMRGMEKLITDGMGGQRRRLGRTLMANNMSDRNNSHNFEAIVRSAVRRLQNDSGDQNVTFHICAGLAGGTGSGSIVDAVSLIHKWFYNPQDSRSFKMRLMVYIPEQTLVYSSAPNEFYQANGYAALSELNAMSVGKYYPVDITGEKDLNSGEVKRLLKNADAFEACYIYSNVNESGKILELTKELPSLVANFLFQSIVVSDIVGNSGRMARVERSENDGAAAELDHAGEPTRSRKFLSFGITRVSYPESEIREFVTYSYATQVAKQLTYNYWLEGQGYSERPIEEVGTGYIEEIGRTQNRGRWMLDNARLMLSTAIIDNDSTRRWREIDNTWNSRTAQEINYIMQTVANKKLWVNNLTERCRIFFDQEFRNQGVKAFYISQRRELKAYAVTIRKHIEKEMFEDWIAGRRSMLEIEKYIQLLYEDCEDRREKFVEQTAKLRDTLPTFNAEMEQCKREYDSIGWLRDSITKISEKILNRYQTAITNYYITLTRIEAYGYARELLAEVVNELREMQEGVGEFKERIAKINTKVKEQADSKCKTNEEQDEANIKKYDPERVRMIVKQYISNKDYQDNAAQEIRNSFMRNIGEDGEPSFARLCNRTDTNSVSDTILDICTNKAVEVMEETARTSPLSRMIDVNILEKLKQELITDEQLEQFVKNIVEKSRPYVQFNARETPKGDVAMQTMVQVCIPKADNNTSDFRAKLINAFQRVCGIRPQDDISEHYRNNEIVCVSVKAGFPLRFLANMVILREKYERLLAAPNGNFNKMVLHTESGLELPPLFEKDKAEIKREVFKSLMLAYTLNLIQEQQDPTTGERFYAMKKKDDFGYDEWTRLGKDFAAVWDILGGDYAKAVELKNLVNKTLETEARSNEQKAALKPLLGKVLTEHVKVSLCENNEFHKDYQGYKNLAIEIGENELKQL